MLREPERKPPTPLISLRHDFSTLVLSPRFALHTIMPAASACGLARAHFQQDPQIDFSPRKDFG